MVVGDKITKYIGDKITKVIGIENEGLKRLFLYIYKIGLTIGIFYVLFLFVWVIIYNVGDLTSSDLLRSFGSSDSPTFFLIMSIIITLFWTPSYLLILMIVFRLCINPILFIIEGFKNEKK